MNEDVYMNKNECFESKCAVCSGRPKTDEQKASGPPALPEWTTVVHWPFYK